MRTPKFWYQPFSVLALLLLPLSGIFYGLMKARQLFYRLGVTPTRFAVPIIVVGNLTVGGSGKTPLVLALAQLLKDKGYRPGIVSRGYGGRKRDPYLVLPEDDAKAVGDEALLLAIKSWVPVVVARKRAEAVRFLLDHTDCNVVLSDDGLQHLALARDIEIVVMDAVQGFGNGYLLPAGPLRETRNRLTTVDFVIEKNGTCAYALHYVFNSCINLKTEETVALSTFIGKKVYAVAGIAHPEQFFKGLRDHGLHCETKAYPDHYFFAPTDFTSADIILMTEKDAVKCQSFCDERYWYVPIEGILTDAFKVDFLKRLSQLQKEKV